MSLLFIIPWLSFLHIRSSTYIRYKQVLKHPFSTFLTNMTVTPGSPTRAHYIIAVRSLPLKSHIADPALRLLKCLVYLV